eukprot:7819877-Pyramimonas_sp.AAC.1
MPRDGDTGCALRVSRGVFPAEVVRRWGARWGWILRGEQAYLVFSPPSLPRDTKRCQSTACTGQAA